MLRRFFSFLLFLALIITGLSIANFVFAQNLDVGTNVISNTIALSATDPRIIIGRIINIALLFLGVIVVALIIYAGFVWMTSGGNEDKVSQAKKILTNAVIGLVIILSAWGIVSFVLSRLLGATTVGGIFNNNRNNSALEGLGAIGACTIEHVYPEDGQTDVSRNASIIITFKEPLRLDSVCQNEAGDNCACNQSDCRLINVEHIRLFRQDLGDNCSNSGCPADNTNISQAYAKVASDRLSLIITPFDFLGSADGDTEYNVKLTSGLVKDDGYSIFKTCGSDIFQWSFTVSNNLDLTPPQIMRGGIFPLPDNEADLFGQSTLAIAATAAIQVQSCPNTYRPASVLSVTPTSGGQSGSAVVDSSYHSNFSILTVVSTVGNDQAQIFAGQSLLGVAPWQDNNINFPGFLSLQVSGHEAAYAWDIALSPEVLADNLGVAGELYNFADNNTGNNIFVDDVSCDLNAVASSIYAKLSGNPDVNVDKTGARVSLSAKVAGLAGNYLRLTTNHAEALSLQPFSGGLDRTRNNETRGRQDRPMNSVIQINFNEAVNPLMVSGKADEVAPYIRIVNADSSAPAGAVCVKNSDCASYKCDNGACVGNHLAGNFLVSNAYKTVEFISDTECGQNGCGEKIYCLPADSHLAVELVSSNLKTCTTSDDCVNFQPFSTCAPFSTYKTCQDMNGKNYPVANIDSLDGVVDASLNSLDGNRDIFADGPLSFYNENEADNLALKDKYKWSFYINDQIISSPPLLSFIGPDNDSVGADTKAPVKINFNTLMMNSSLRTGQVMVNNGESEVPHHLINLFSVSPSPLGYWVKVENRDVLPLDGEPDTSFVFVHHTEMLPSAAYKAQVGSGVKDIYQNCYKPSAGPACAADLVSPSCCYGAPTSVLGEDGNCQ